jgi:hypothetical protein
MMPNFADAGGEMKSLACIFGRHRWATHDEHGEEYNVCSRCGKVPKELTVESYAEAQRLAEQLDNRRRSSMGR